MANTIIIQKLTNGNVKITDSTAITKSRTRESGFATRIIDAERVVVEDTGTGRGVEEFSYVDVEKVIRDDGTEIIISDLATLYSELETYFFFEVATGGGSTLVATSKIFTILAANWQNGGEGVGSTHYFVVDHDLGTDKILEPSIWETDTGTRELIKINGFFTTGLGITDSTKQVRIETVNNTINVDGVVSSGGSSVVLNSFIYGDEETSDFSPVAKGGQVIPVNSAIDVNVTINTNYCDATETVYFEQVGLGQIILVAGTQVINISTFKSLKSSSQNALIGVPNYNGVKSTVIGDTE